LAEADTKSSGFLSAPRDSAEPSLASQSQLKSWNSRDRQSSNVAGMPGARRLGRVWIWRVSLCLVVVGVGYGGLRALGFWSTPSPDTIWKQAEADLQSRRYDRVDSAVKQLSRLRKPTPQDWFLRAQLTLARNQADQAIDLLSRVPDDHYAAPRARLLAGQTELRRNRIRRAEEWLIAAIKLEPRLVQAHRELIYIYSTQLRRTELNAEFMALSRLSNLTFDNAFHWGLLRSNSWEPGKMIGPLSRYVDVDPGDRWSRLALAENYRRMGLPGDAERTLAGLPRGEPEVIDLLARIELDRSDLEEAERLLATGRSDDPLLARLRGRLALARGDAKSAIDYFRIAFTADPLSRETVFGLSAAFQLSGDTKAAEPYRQTAANLDRLNSLVRRAGVPQGRGDPNLMRQLGAACAALQLNAEARAWYKLAISSNPLDSESQQALYRLNDSKASQP
jgi:tetratricopeptide (TPR) repeat protein